MNFNIESVEKESVATFLIDLVFLITPGIILIFYFFPDLFKMLDVLKLIMLSVAFFSPLFLINTFILINNIKDIFYSFSLGIFLTNIVFYVSLATAYYFKLSLENTISLVLVFEVILIVLLKSSFFKNKK